MAGARLGDRAEASLASPPRFIELDAAALRRHVGFCTRDALFPFGPGGAAP
jgi:hypothetical protein